MVQFKLDVLFNWGGLGDMICRLPAMKRLVTLYGPQMDLRVFVPKYFLEVFHAVIPEVKFLSTLDMAAPLRDPSRAILDFTPFTFTPMRMHLVDNAFLTLLDRYPDSDADRNYLRIPTEGVAISQFDLPRRFVVVTTGFTAPVREFKPHTINETVKWLKSQQIDVVFLGKTDIVVGDEKQNIIKGKFSADINFAAGLDLRNKTSLFEAARIMERSLAVVGLDNGLLHLAGMTEVPIVAAYTTVEPVTRLPVRHGQLGWRCVTVTPDVQLECRACQTHQNFTRHDFKLCPYGDYACTEQITPGKIIGGLKEIFGTRRW